MSFQRVHQSKSQSPQASSSTSQFVPRPFSVQEPKRLPTQEDIENEAFQQNKFEAFGLQLKEKHGILTPVEQERLGVLQAKMDSFWAVRMKRVFAQPTLSEMLIRDAQTTQTTESQAPVQSNTVQAKGEITGDRLESSVEQRPNKTGLPDALKAGVENLSGYSLDDVRVHYNSPKPAQLQALAYTQGQDIHVAPEQEKHLPHEAWHVVQQMQGRVKPTMQMNGAQINDNEQLEQEADNMGVRVLQRQESVPSNQILPNASKQQRIEAVQNVQQGVVQRVLTGEEEPGDKIKIVIEGEVKEVYLARPWKEGNESVFYIEKLGKKQKYPIPAKECGKIDANFAFPSSKANKEILAEIKQADEATQELENSKFGPLNIPEDCISYLLKLVRDNRKAYKLEVEPNEVRIKLMISSLDWLSYMFVGSQATTLKDLEFIEEDDSYIETIMDVMKGTGIQKSAPSSSGGGSSSHEEWKTKKTDKLKAMLLNRIEGSKFSEIVSDESTLHHKMSRSHFKALLALLKETPVSQPGVEDMWNFIKEIQQLTHSGDPETALENWAANIELGPKVERRKKGDDPGEFFDGNYPGGSPTPRTEQLQEVDLIISHAKSSKDINWKTIAGLLRQTQLEHRGMTKELGLGEEEFTNPHLNQWQSTEDGFIRDKPITKGKVEDKLIKGGAIGKTSEVLAIDTWENASYMKLSKGQKIRITKHSVDISDRIFELKEDYDPSNFEYPDINNFVKWVNQ